MGGAACTLIIHALVRYEEVPRAAGKRKELEAQLRQCYANPTIAAAVEEHGNAVAMYEILEKPELDGEDLEALLHGLPEYSGDEDNPGG